MVTQQKPETIAAKGTGLVLLTLASAQFLMTLDSSVMNVSMATVAKDVGTTVTGIQGAITAYTLVMAAAPEPGETKWATSAVSRTRARRRVALSGYLGRTAAREA